MTLLKRFVSMSLCALALMALVCSGLDAQAPKAPAWKGGLTLGWSTLFGGPYPCIIRAMTADSAGNLYAAGLAGGPGFPTTPGAFQRAFGGGKSNAFVAKFDPDGRLIWSTLFGGEGEGDCYAASLALDGEGNVYIAGGANPGLHTTAAAVQPKFRGFTVEGRGEQNGFIAKFTPDGAHLLWATYLGTGDCVHDISAEADGDVYAATAYDSEKSPAPPPGEWFFGGFQRKPETASSVFIVKIKSDGTRVMAGTYLAAPGGRTGPCALARDAAGEVCAAFSTTAAKMPVYKGYNPSHHGETDLYLAKLTGDLTAIVFGTYVGGAGAESARGHHLVLDGEGNAFVAMTTTSSGLAASRGAVQPYFAGGTGGDVYVAKISADGTQLLGATYFGGSGDDYGCDGLALDRDGNVCLAFTTASLDARTTPDALQRKFAGGASDGFLVKISADFMKLLYATYLGGSGYNGGGWDEPRALLVEPSGNVVVAGDTAAADFPTKHASQDVLAGGENGFLAKFLPASVPPIRIKTNSAEYMAADAIVVTVTASPGEGAIRRVDFYADGRLVGTSPAAPWGFTWNDAMPGGWHVQAVAVGDLGASSESNTVDLTVSGDRNLPPAILTPATARPNPVDCLREDNLGRTVSYPAMTTLSVAASDDDGDAALVYTWRVTAKPPGAADPFFSANESNLAKTTRATFFVPGAYTFEVSVKDPADQVVKSTVGVRVMSVR